MALADQLSRANLGKPGQTEFGDTIAPDTVSRQSPQQRGALLQYQRAQVESASPTRLVVLLYEGAIRFCRIAQQAMRNQEWETQNTNLVRAQRIVGELLASLNRGGGGDVASNLANIYAHMLAELVEANLYDKPEKLDHVLSLLSEMRASWVEIDRIASCDGQLVDGPIDPANTGGLTANPAPIQPAKTPIATLSARPDPRMARRIAAQNSAAVNVAPKLLGDRLA